MTRILCINTGGAGSLDEARARTLAACLEADVTHFGVVRSASRAESGREISRLLRSESWDMVYQEGTGIAAGASLIRAAREREQRFIVSGGDPIGGFFHVTAGPVHGLAFGLYERALYRACAGYVGWTPYLTGMALALGAKRAVTVEGGVDLALFQPCSPTDRLAYRQKWNIPASHLVCGVVGSLRWTPRQSYCYGLELLETLKRLRREDVTLLIVGDGDGRSRLEQALPAALRHRAVFTGRVPAPDVAAAINCMDIGFITQTLDRLGNYRLTTKLPEYMACGVPVAMSPVPGFYDYAAPAGWALPALHPASPMFHQQCAAWLDDLEAGEIRAKAGHAREVAVRHFDYEVLGRRFRRFVQELLPVGNRSTEPHKWQQF